LIVNQEKEEIMIKGESINAEQVLEGIERRRQIRGAVGFGVIVVLAVVFIFIIF